MDEFKIEKSKKFINFEDIEKSRSHNFFSKSNKNANSSSKIINSPVIDKNKSENLWYKFFFRSDTIENSEEEVKFNLVVEQLTKFYIKEKKITFKLEQFLEMLCIHLLYFLFGPFICPILNKIFGIYTIRNLGFWGKKLIKSHLIQIIYFINFHITIILTIVYYTKEKDLIIYFIPSYLSQIIVIIRYIIVCIKYGYYPKDYFKKWKNKAITRTEIKSNFLFYGWIKPSSLFLDCYLKEVLEKLEIDTKDFTIQCIGNQNTSIQSKLDETNKKIKDDASKIRKSFCRRLYKQNILNKSIKNIIKKYYCDTLVYIKKSALDIKNGNIKFIAPKLRFQQFYYNHLLPHVRKEINCENLYSKLKLKSNSLYEIKCVDLLRLILKDVFSIKLSNYYTILFLSTFFFCVIPIIFTFLFQEKIELESYIFITYSVLTLIPPSYLILLNLSYGVIDFERKKLLMEICTQLICPKDITSDKRIYPLINFLDPNSITNWYQIRNILFLYGQRFSLRIKTQASLYCILAIIGFITLIIIFIIDVSNNTFMNNTPYFVVYSFTIPISINFIFVLYMFFIGANVNEGEMNQCHILLKHWMLLNEEFNNNSIVKNNNEKSESLIEGLEILNLNSSNETSYNKIFLKLFNENKDFNQNNLKKSMELIKIIRKKLKLDNIVSPVRIFWIRADYSFFSRLIALASTATSIILGKIFFGKNS